MKRQKEESPEGTGPFTQQAQGIGPGSTNLVLFPVPKDIVLKLIELYSTQNAICNNCEETICPTLECFKCKKKFNVHNDQRHLCFNQRKCRDCKQFFCTNCAELKWCAKPTISSWTPYEVGRCNGSVTRCTECLAKKVCDKCGLDISRCYYCEEDPDSLAGAYITKHICGNGRKGWYSGLRGYVDYSEIDDLPMVN